MSDTNLLGRTTLTLADFGQESEAFACGLLTDTLPMVEVEYLRGVANRLKNDIGLSKEVPPRLRGVQYLAPEVVERLEALRVAPQLSELAGLSLALHPSAHFGCAFNWTARRVDSLADDWHLDAAEYTAIILLSDPGIHFTGGELTLFRGYPQRLWSLQDSGCALVPADIHTVPFRQSGQVFLFKGRQLPHCVQAVMKTPLGQTRPFSGRLTLALGLYAHDTALAADSPEPADRISDVSSRWRLESKKAHLMAELQRLRHLTHWEPNLEEARHQEAQLDVILERLTDLRGPL